MKLFIKYIVVLLLLFQIALSGCKLIIYKVYFKAKLVPKYTSEKKINKYYKKHADTQDNLVLLSDSSFVEKIEEPGWAFESWNLYNRSGQRLRRGSDSLACFGSDSRFLKDFNIENAIIDSGKNLSLDYFTNQKLYNPSIGNRIEIDTVSEYDYTLLLYWSTWRGRFSEDILELEKAFVLNNPQLRIRVLKVNMDFREEMENTWVNKFDLWSKEVKQRKEKK